jgi:hypothetical protein
LVSLPEAVRQGASESANVARLIDPDDRRSVTFGLADPCRLTILNVSGYQVRIDEVHAFMWLALKYQEAGRKRMAKHAAYAIRKNALRLLEAWLADARFKEGDVH